MFLFKTGAYAQNVMISEVVSDNKSFLDSYGKTPDWLELYNSSPSPACLGEYSISDKNDPFTAWPLPDTCINSHSFILFFLSDERSETVYAPFSLGQFKEKIYLFRNDVLIDSGTTCIPSGYSYGTLQTDLQKYHFSIPTPGSANNASSATHLDPEPDTLWTTSQSGFYQGAISPQLKTLKGTSVYYTINGEFPDATSSLYSPALTFTSEKVPKEHLSLIETADGWKKPLGDVFNGIIMRAVGYSEGCPVTNEVIASYFFDVADRYRFPVFSLVTDPDDFFDDDDGIYVKGIGEEPNFSKRGSQWEKDIDLQLIVGNELKFRTEAEASIHGRYTRFKSQKSLRLEAHDKEKFDYPFFGEGQGQFSSLTLQTVDKHSSSTFFKDELISEIVRPFNFGTMLSQPSIVFLNAEYWGVHNLRERQDEDFIETYFGINADDVLLLEEPIFKEPSEFTGFVEDVAAMDLSVSENYDRICEQIDIDNFINYIIAQIYFSNFDWPHNNVRVWKSKSLNSKWHFLFYDCDVCMTNAEYDVIYKSLTDEYPEHPVPVLIDKLFEQEKFRIAFLQRFLYHISNTFSPSLILPVIDRYEQQYAPVVFEHINRWNNPNSFETWKSNVDRMKTFAVTRPGIMTAQLIQHLGNPVKLYPNPSHGVSSISFMNGVSYTVNIFNNKGSVVASLTQPDGFLPDLSSLSKGFYIVEVIYGELIFRNKLIIN